MIARLPSTTKSKGAKHVRTKNKAIVAAEISPILRERIEAYRIAHNKNSNSEVLREALTDFFLKQTPLKALKDIRRETSEP